MLPHISENSRIGRKREALQSIDLLTLINFHDFCLEKTNL